MQNLSPIQEKHLESILWLISSKERLSGRTRTLAYAFIKTAINNPGLDIPLFDHLTYPSALIGLYREIRLLTVSDEFIDKSFYINASMRTLVCK